MKYTVSREGDLFCVDAIQVRKVNDVVLAHLMRAMVDEMTRSPRIEDLFKILFERYMEEKDLDIYSDDILQVEIEV